MHFQFRPSRPMILAPTKWPHDSFELYCAFFAAI